MKIKLNRTILWICLNSLMGLTTAANIAYVPKIGPGNYAAAGYGRQWPTTRFITDVTGNCKIDQLTGLMWAKDLSLLGTGTWSLSSTSGTAQYKVDQMNLGSSSDVGYMLCGYKDWRLPNINELKSMINYASYQTGSNSVEWLGTQGFVNIPQSIWEQIYWSSTQAKSSKAFAFVLSGIIGSESTDVSLSIWPVRGGK